MVDSFNNIIPVPFTPPSLPAFHYSEIVLPTLPSLELPSNNEMLVTAAELLSNLVVSGSLGVAGGAIGSLVGLTLPIIGPEVGALIFGGLFSALGDATNQCVQMYLRNGVITSLNTEQICAAGITGVLSGKMFGTTFLGRLGFNFFQGVVSRSTIEGICAVQNTGSYKNGFDEKIFADNVFDFWKVISDVGFGEMFHRGFTVMQHWSPPAFGPALVDGPSSPQYIEKAPPPLVPNTVFMGSAKRPATITEYPSREFTDYRNDPNTIYQHQSYAEEYFQYTLTPEQINQLKNNGMKIVDECSPRETLFICDNVISYHRFGKYDDKWWLIKNPSKYRLGNDTEYANEMVYGFSQTLGLGVAETRAIVIDSQEYLASRFLDNAIHGDLQFMPPELRKKVVSQLPAYFPFNYFMAIAGDLQYVYTTDGRVMMMDYSVLPIIRVPNPSGTLYYFSGSYNLNHNRGAGIEPLSAYLPMIEKIESISDKEIFRLTSFLPEQAKSFKEPMNDYREQVRKRLILRRDNIRETFTRFFSQQ